MTISKVSNSQIIVSEILGAAFTSIDNALFCTPIFIDDSYDDDEDSWIEVDHLSVLGEEKYIQDEVNRLDILLTT